MVQNNDYLQTDMIAPLSERGYKYSREWSWKRCFRILKTRKHMAEGASQYLLSEIFKLSSGVLD